MTPVIFPFPGNEAIAASLARRLGMEIGSIEIRRFPDGESYVRFLSPVKGKPVIFLCTLDQPDGKFLPLVFAAATARELGAGRIGLVAPYLAYMRQDKRFHPGEAVTSTYFAAMVNQCFDWMVTVDPHLHRRASLSEIYTMPTATLHAASAIAAWIRDNIPAPVLIGPDSESDQWVATVAKGIGAPFLTLEKTRHGDRDVAISVPDIEKWRQYRPVLLDDIISTARTMIETITHLKRAGLPPAVCIAIHAVFAGNAYEELKAAGVKDVVTCNTINHPSNEIDLAPLLAEGIRSITCRD